ncbi:MAG: T9SS type A sorting domain-containing protein, partial [Melioribacteraceae bacterium]|nr:T9SS type A sorting domain-containing protein [Melioribacteraceae bacterium]
QYKLCSVFASNILHLIPFIDYAKISIYRKLWMVFRHSDGVQDDVTSYERIFSSEDDSSFPDWTWTYGTKVTAIAIDHTTPSERIFVGLFDDEDWDETTDHNGAIFMGENVSGTWTWTQITSSVFPDGVDVFDIVAVSENGNTVLYVGVMRNTAFSTTTNGIYRIEETSPGVWSSAQDLYSSATFPLAASILDIAKSATDTLHICGTDASISNPVIYKKAIGDTYWQVIPSYGFAGDELVAKSITFDNVSTTYIAVDNKIFENSTSATSWTKFYEYPLGTEINFIYYDDLLVGTGTGLYMHPEVPNAVHDESKMPDNFELYQNYPNPFNPSTVIKYEIRDSRFVSLKVFNTLGQEVATLVNQKQNAGSYIINFDASELTSGVYLYQILAGDFAKTKKMILMY